MTTSLRMLAAAALFGAVDVQAQVARPLPALDRIRLSATYRYELGPNPASAAQLQGVMDRLRKAATDSEKANLASSAAALMAGAEGGEESGSFTLIANMPDFRAVHENVNSPMGRSLAKTASAAGLTMQSPDTLRQEWLLVEDIAIFSRTLRDPQAPASSSVAEVWPRTSVAWSFSSTAYPVQDLIDVFGRNQDIPPFQKTYTNGDGFFCGEWDAGPTYWIYIYDKQGRITSIDASMDGKEALKTRFTYGTGFIPTVVTERTVSILGALISDRHWRITAVSEDPADIASTLPKVELLEGMSVWDHRFEPVVKYLLQGNKIMEGRELFQLASQQAREFELNTEFVRLKKEGRAVLPSRGSQPTREPARLAERLRALQYPIMLVGFLAAAVLFLRRLTRRRAGR